MQVRPTGMATSFRLMIQRLDNVKAGKGELNAERTEI
jgi:hypothetical protein